MPKDPGFFIALAIGLGLIAWVVRWIIRQTKAHRQALETIAHSLGLKYHRDGEGIIKTSHPAFSWFRKGHSFNLNHAIEGSHQGYNIQFFELASREDENNWTNCVFAVQKEGADFGEFSIEPDFQDHSLDEDFNKVFKCKSGDSDFAKYANESFKAKWVEIRTNNKMKSKHFRTSPYFIRCSEDRIVCNWPTMPFAKDANWFHECLNETILYAETLK